MSSNPLVKRMLVLYGEPKTDDPEAYAAEYVNALRSTDKEILDLAGDMLVRERKYRSWPTVAEVLDTVDRAKLQMKYSGKAAVHLETIENFDRWWHDVTTRVRHADTEAQIKAAIAVMEPYWSARWIDKKRMPEIQDLADMRRKELAVRAAGRFADRVIGEGDAA